MLGRRRSICASFTVIQGLRRHGERSSEPSEMFRSPRKKRKTKNVRGPRVSTWAVTPRLMPVIIAAIAMTTITPIATPRMVSAARPLLARTESRAMPTPS